MALTSVQVTKLLKIPVFRGLTQTEGQEFFASANEMSVVKDAVLFREGDTGDGLLVILEGEVLVTRGGVELARLMTDSVFGEMSLVGNGETRSATVTAVRDVKLLKFPAAAFQSLIRKDSLSALKVVANIAQVLSKRLHAINQKFVETLDKGKKKQELADFGKILNNWSF